MIDNSLLACSPESFFSLSPSHGPQPLGFHEPLDSPTSLCLSPRLSSPHWVSFLSQGPAGRHVGTGGRQAAHPGSRGSSAVQSAEAPRSAALCCACTAATLLTSTSHPPVPRAAAAPAQAGAVRCRRCVGSGGRGGRGESREE